MLSVESNGSLHGKPRKPARPHGKRRAHHQHHGLLLSKISPARLKEAIGAEHQLTTALEGLIATSEAVFEFIRHSEMEPGLKNAFAQLEKQHEFYRKLVG